ncbi:MAG TPA: HAMP domain-containing sensor histidine kinase [Gaiellaceae bacterium]
MRHLKTVGARLSLALVLVVAAVLAFVYLIVTPSLEDRLVGSRQDQVAEVARQITQYWPHRKPSDTPKGLAASYAAASNTRVIILSVDNRTPLSLSVIADQGAGGSAVATDTDPVARKAANELDSTRGVVARGERRFAEAAEPTPDQDYVVLVSSSIEDSLGSVTLVRHRLLISALFALGAALLLGYVGARLFARRIRRLEQAAERIASGKFDEPIVDNSPDELGQLARAFDRMRERLAGLERARREFIANASHELRTPLFSLGGHLELLVDEELDEATKQEFLERMREQVDRLTKLAGELLDLSRLDAGRLRVDREPVELAQVVETLVEEFGARAQGTGHDLELDGVDRGATGLGDEQRILQVGRALVENAIRHTPAGTRVVLGASRNGDRVALTVSDDGPGIAPAAENHVFERFYRGDTGGRASGSGLGLAIARELAEAMHGDIDLSSQPGRTVFTLSLPAQSATSSPTLD